MPSPPTTTRDRPVALLDGELALPATALRNRAVADPDEDAVTLAAAAALPCWSAPSRRRRRSCSRRRRRRTTRAAACRSLAELLGLAGDLVALELTASLADGLTAIRVAAGLVAAGDGPVLVVAAHRTRGERDAGDGAVALLLGADGGVARARPAGARTSRSCATAGASPRRPTAPRATRASSGATASRASPRSSATARPASPADRARRLPAPSARLAGAGDAVAPAVGVLGAAHPLARVLRRARVAAAVSSPARAASSRSSRSSRSTARRRSRTPPRAVLGRERRAEPPDAGRLERARAVPVRARGAGASAARTSGSRGSAAAGCGALVFPHRPTCPACGSRELAVERLPRAGTVVTGTRDHVYPAGKATGMAVVELDGGGTLLRPGRPVRPRRDRRAGAPRAAPPARRRRGRAVLLEGGSRMPIAGEVAIVGAATTAFGVLHERGYIELLAEAAFGALDDAGLGLDRLGSAWLGTAEPGLTGLVGDAGTAVAEAIGFAPRPVTRGRELLLHGARGGARGGARRRGGRARARARGRRREDARRAEPRQPRRAHRRTSRTRRSRRGAPHRGSSRSSPTRYMDRFGVARETLAKRRGEEPRARAAEPEGALPQAR